MDILNERTYDSVFWTSVVKMTRFFIPLVNEAFGEHFSDDATISLKQNKRVLEHLDGSFEQHEVDALAELSEADITKDYHFEVETWRDNTFAIRIARSKTIPSMICLRRNYSCCFRSSDSILMIY